MRVTLVEIMLVVAVIALLIVIALPSFLRARQQSQNAKYINALRVATSVFEQYAAEHNAYPEDVNEGVMPAGMESYFGPTLGLDKADTDRWFVGLGRQR